MWSRITARGRAGHSLAAALVLSLAVAPAAAAETTRPAGKAVALEDLAPDDVFAFVTFAGLEDSSGAAEKLGLYQLWREPEVQDFLASVVNEYEVAARDTPDEVMQVWGEVKRQLAGRVSLILGDLTMVWIDGGPVPMPGAVLALEMRGRRAELEQSFALLFDPKDDGERGIERTSAKHGGVDVVSLRQVRSGPRLSVAFAFVDDLLLVGLNDHLLGRCLANLTQPRTKTLADSPAFRRSREKAASTGSAALVEAFLNVEAFTSRVRGLAPVEVLEVCHVLGLDSLRALYYASAVHGGATQDTLYLDAPAPRRGLLALGGQGVIDQQSLAFVPETAAFCAALRVSPKIAWEAIWDAMEGFAPPGEVAQAKRELGYIESELGFEIEAGLLEAIGEELVVYAELPTNGLVPNVVLSLALRDRGAAERILRTLLGAAGASVREVSLQGHTVHVVDPGDDIPIRPSFALSDERLVFSVTPAGVRAALRRLGEDQSAGVVASASFQRAFEGLDWKGAGYVQYVDVERVASFGYNLLENFLPGLVDQASVPVDPFLLPSEEVLLAHLSGFAELGRSDADGLVMRSRGIGLASALALGARFLDKASGCAPFLLGQALASHEVQVAQAGAQSERHAHASAPSSGVVNAVEPGDPSEAAFRDLVVELDDAIARRPEDGQLYFRRGLTKSQLRLRDAAVLDFEKARALGYGEAICAYNIACCRALQGEKDTALDWLRTSFREGFDRWNTVEADGDLDALRADARFATLVAEFRAR